MTPWVLLVFGIVATVEVSLHLPIKKLAFNTYNSIISSINIAQNPSYTDEQKQQKLLNSSLTLFKTTFLAFTLLVIMTLPIILLLIVSELLGLSLYDILNSTLGLLISCIVSLLYFYMRKYQN